MTSKSPSIGLIGVGRWGQVLSGKLTQLGAHLIAHDRRHPANHPTKRVPWPEMIAAKDIHALVIATPPGTTLEIAVACARAGKPVLATKPLMLEERLSIKAPFYVDYLHLWSLCWLSLKQICGRHKIRSIASSFYADGPCRPFPALLDYGSHALAMVHDLMAYIGSGSEEIEFSSTTETSQGEKNLTSATGKTTSGIDIEILAGNCLPCPPAHDEPPIHLSSRQPTLQQPTRRVEVTFLDGRKVTYEEQNLVGFLTFCKRHQRIPHDSLKGQDPLTALGRQFLHDIIEDKADPYLADLSFLVSSSLRKIQRATVSNR